MVEKDNFYENLNIIPDFSEVYNTKYYKDAPNDWHVVIADIKGSTKAFEKGLYKEVNIVGVSCIIAVINAIGSREIAFVFGGDGASFILPPEYLETAIKALLGTQKVAKESFNLELRVGSVKISEIHKKKQKVRLKTSA